jgi:2'-5' RNA ligase
LYELGKIRTFLSLNTGQEAQYSLNKIQDLLKTDLKDQPVKWDDPEKFHITLRFLGDIDVDSIKGLIFTLERIKTDFEEIRFDYDSIGFFPNQKYPNVVYAGLNEAGNNSAKLVEFIDSIIHNFGVKPEKRFVPHITLGRFRKDKRKKITKIIDIQAEPFNMIFSSFFLMKSVLKPTGSEFEIIKEFSFNN